MPPETTAWMMVERQDPHEEERVCELSGNPVVQYLVYDVLDKIDKLADFFRAVGLQASFHFHKRGPVEQPTKLHIERKPPDAALADAAGPVRVVCSQKVH